MGWGEMRVSASHISPVSAGCRLDPANGGAREKLEGRRREKKETLLIPVCLWLCLSELLHLWRFTAGNSSCFLCLASFHTSRTSFIAPCLVVPAAEPQLPKALFLGALPSRSWTKAAVEWCPLLQASRFWYFQPLSLQLLSLRSINVFFHMFLVLQHLWPISYN